MIALLLLIPACFGGVLLAFRLDERSSRWSDTLALGAALGLALLAAFGFVLGWLFGLSFAVVALAALLVVAAGFTFGVKPEILLTRRRGRPGAALAILAVLIVALVVRLADRTLLETPSGIATGARHNFGDLPFHMAIAAGFAYGNNFPPEHPELAGVPLTYPFFGDVISGMILAVGGSWRDAFFWPTLILGLSLVPALTRFGEAVTGSRSLGRVATALTLFSGGLGFSTLTNPASWSVWWNNGPDLTIAENGVRYANFIVTLFIPQRSILFGWPLLFFALALLVEGMEQEADRGKCVERWRAAGLIASLLPLVHAHSFAVMGFCAVGLALRAGIQPLLAFAKGVAPAAVPAIVFMMTHNSLSAGRFFEWKPGFDGGADAPFLYWLRNAGLFLPLAMIGIARARAGSMRRMFALPFAALFVAANLFRLSPWIWDNMKFLAPAHAGLAPFAALSLGLIWRRGALGKAVAVLGFVIATLSGALDVSKIVFARGTFDLFDRFDLVFAENIREATPPGTVVLTSPTHDHPVLLSGRRLFLGYEGHLWSQGLTYQERKPVAEAMFHGATPKAAGSSAAMIGAIAVTPAENALITDPEAFQGLPSFVDSPYRLLRVR